MPTPDVPARDVGDVGFSGEREDLLGGAALEGPRGLPKRVVGRSRIGFEGRTEPGNRAVGSGILNRAHAGRAHTWPAASENRFDPAHGRALLNSRILPRTSTPI